MHSEWTQPKAVRSWFCVVQRSQDFPHNLSEITFPQGQGYIGEFLNFESDVFIVIH